MVAARGNETASERYMFRKYMIDSILFGQKNITFPDLDLI